MSTLKKKNGKANDRVADTDRYMPNGIAAVLRQVKDHTCETESEFSEIMSKIILELNKKFKPLTIQTAPTSLIKFLNKRHCNDGDVDFRLLIAYAQAAECHNLNLQLLAQMASMEARRFDQDHMIEFLDTLIELSKFYKKEILKKQKSVFIDSAGSTEGMVEVGYDVNNGIFEKTVEIYKNRKARKPNLDISKLL